MSQSHERAARGEQLLSVNDVYKHFKVSGTGFLGKGAERVHAVDGVSLDVRQGETLGLVGETGCGKSTLARCITGLHPLSSGSITFDGVNISALSRRKMRPYRADIQMIFQDPYGSLNPRRRVGSIISDPFVIHKTDTAQQRKRRVQELMQLVGLNPEHYNRFPADFSGGQRQRIGIARALALRPRLIVCDEPIAALDVSIQAQVLNLLGELQEEFGLTYVFIAHDLSAVQHVSDRIAVMYLGKVAEIAETTQLTEHPRHPYANALMSAAPVADPKQADRREQIVLSGDMPSPIHPPNGCRFHPRCPKAGQRCRGEEPPLQPRLDDPDEHRTACHFPVADGERLDTAPAETAEDTQQPAAAEPGAGNANGA